MTDNINDVLNLKSKDPNETKKVRTKAAWKIANFYLFLAFLITITGIIILMFGIAMKTRTDADETIKTVLIVGSIVSTILFVASAIYKAEMIVLTAKIEENTRNK